MADQTIEKTPTAGTSVNKPASGTYGEKADLARLKQQLPSSSAGPQGPQPGPGAGPTPPGVRPAQAGPGAPGEPPPGVPSALLHGTQRPGVPVGQRRVQPSTIVRDASSKREARKALLVSLSQSNEVSDATREWAKTVLGILT